MAKNETLKKQSIIYVNFAPYENAGRILDFLVEEFALVALFSFDFHELQNKTESNYIRLYKNGQPIKQIQLIKLPAPEFLLFISMPLITLFITLQTIWHGFALRRRYGAFDVYLTVNAFTAWLGTVLRHFGVVRKTIFWVWDYFPPGYPDWRLKIIRWAYWRFDVASSKSSDSIIFLNQKLVSLRQEIAVLPIEKSYPIVPIGTYPGKLTKPNSLILGHLGVLKDPQGLDLLFDALPAILKQLPDVKVEIIGSGPEEAHFRERAKPFRCVRFYGFVKEEDRVDEIIRGWSAGIATYIPVASNTAGWTDPSKIKAYLSQGVPVITTPITPLSVEIREQQAGFVLDAYKPEQLVEAVVALNQNPDQYRKNAYTLAKKYHYQTLYQDLFKEH